MHLISQSYIYVLKSAVARYQTIQRTMATERRDEEGNSSRGETAGNSETDSPPLAHGKHFALHLRPLVNVLCVCVCVCVCVCTQHAKRHMCLCDVCAAESRRDTPCSPGHCQKITQLLQSPAVKFITHPEFFTVLHANYVSASALCTRCSRLCVSGLCTVHTMLTSVCLTVYVMH